MTAYDAFRTRQIAAQVGGFVAFLVFCGGMALLRYHPYLGGTVLGAAWIALIACAFLLFAGNRCPRCDKKMRDIPISCPRCGLNLTSVKHDDPNDPNI